MSVQVQNTGEAKGYICFLEYNLRPQAGDWVFCYLWPLGVTTGKKAHPCLNPDAQLYGVGSVERDELEVSSHV